MVKELLAVDSSSPDAGARVALAVLNILSLAETRSSLSALCIGSDRATGDSLGPLVGSLLTWNGFCGKVLGTLDKPVHAQNLEAALTEIHNENSLIIGVDACLGVTDEVGSIIVRKGPLKPGLGVKKKLPPVGDLHIAGVVNVGGFMEYMILQNTRLGLVMNMAQAIASGIIRAEQMIKKPSDPTKPGRITVARVSIPLGLENGEPGSRPLQVSYRQP